MGSDSAIYNICLLLQITSPYSQWNFTLAKKLLANDKISASFFNKNVFQALYLKLQTKRMNFEKLQVLG